MGSAQQIILQYVCPGLGAAIAFVMFSSPFKSIREVNKRKYLGVSSSSANGLQTCSLIRPCSLRAAEARPDMPVCKCEHADSISIAYYTHNPLLSP
jgi:hypothetical protein